MGSCISQPSNMENNIVKEQELNNQEQKKLQNKYDMEVIEVSNIALAIKNKQHNINVELSLRCENLPAVKAFGSTDSMIAILKSEDQGKDNSAQTKESLVEIGRTEVIANELNPKFITTFMFPFNEQKNEYIYFRIYHVLKPNGELKAQKLLGTCKIKLDALVDDEGAEIEVDLISKVKSKTLLKINCVEYDGGNAKYQIGIQLNNFVFRSQVYYLIEGWKFGEWIPVVKSEKKKPSRFKEIEVSINKFQAQENSNIRIKIFDVDKEEQIGSTKQFSITDINTEQKSHVHRVYHNGFIVGSLQIYKWKRNDRDSFMSYVVGGSQLRLLIAIDFTNSNKEGSSNLHDLDGNGSNAYINGIREIGGVLQYFCVENQIALYGFGAKLPPYYRSVSQCFALNGNYFNPSVDGGIQEVVRLYKETLKKVKMHGPTKISEIMDLAIKYASEEESLQAKTVTYYILLIITDGAINDQEDTVERIITASKLPLSIMFIGVGKGEDGETPFHILERLDSDTIKLQSRKTNTICERDIVDFIRLEQFLAQSNKLTLARETFAEIPKQFIDYMIIKGHKPPKQKKSLKAGKAEFISEKIKSIAVKTRPFISSFLDKEKKQIKKQLKNLGINSQSDLYQKMNIAMNDVGYFVEVNSQTKEVPPKPAKFWNQLIDIKETKDLENYLNWKQSENKRKTLQKLQKIEANQFGRKTRQVKKKAEIVDKVVKHLIHPCLKCGQNQIDLLHMECGHSSLCKSCYSKRCFVCHHFNQEVNELNFEQLQSD